MKRFSPASPRQRKLVKTDSGWEHILRSHIFPMKGKTRFLEQEQEVWRRIKTAWARPHSEQPDSCPGRVRLERSFSVDIGELENGRRTNRLKMVVAVGGREAVLITAYPVKQPC